MVCENELNEVTTLVTKVVRTEPDFERMFECLATIGEAYIFDPVGAGGATVAVASLFKKNPEVFISHLSRIYDKLKKIKPFRKIRSFGLFLKSAERYTKIHCVECSNLWISTSEGFSPRQVSSYNCIHSAVVHKQRRCLDQMEGSVFYNRFLETGLAKKWMRGDRNIRPAIFPD